MWRVRLTHPRPAAGSPSKQPSCVTIIVTPSELRPERLNRCAHPNGCRVRLPARALSARNHSNRVPVVIDQPDANQRSARSSVPRRARGPPVPTSRTETRCHDDHTCPSGTVLGVVAGRDRGLVVVGRTGWGSTRGHPQGCRQTTFGRDLYLDDLLFCSAPASDHNVIARSRSAATEFHSD